MPSFFARLFGKKSANNSSPTKPGDNTSSSASQPQTMCVNGKKYRAILQGGRWVAVGESLGDCEEQSA